MKRIRVSPLSPIEELNLQVIDKKEVGLISPEVAEKILKFVHENKGELIFGTKVKDEEVSVSVSIKTKEGSLVQIPEPNPILIYLHQANEISNILITQRNALLNAGDYSINAKFPLVVALYGSVFVCTSSLVASIEAFINYILPEDIVVAIGDEHLDKKNIDRKDFKFKTKKVLFQCYQKRFCDDFQAKYKHIIDLIKIRNDMIHLKPNLKKNRTFYEELYKSVLDFDPSVYINAVIEYLNYYRPGMVNYEDIEEDKL